MSLTHRSARGRLLSALALASVGALVLAGCSPKGGGGSGGDAGPGAVKTGDGISGGTITLGVLADLTGPFAALSTEVDNALETYWEDVNAKGGVCGAYQVKLDIQDGGYNVQNVVNLYNQTSSNVLAYQQVIGASMALAMIDQAKEDSIVTIPRGGVHALVDNEAALVTGALYTAEAGNALDYAIQQGTIPSGSVLGVIYPEGDYGTTALAGYRAVAEANGITLVEQKVKATDTDMSAQISAFEQAGVTAIGLAATPTATASVASVLASRGKDLPIIGASPTYSPSLLQTDAGQYLRDHMIFSSPAVPFDTAEGKSIYDRVLAAGKTKAPTLQSSIGFGDAAVMHALLEAACASGDLTREGVMAAKGTLADVDTQGAYPTLNYANHGDAATAQTFIVKPADGLAGVELVEGPYQGPNVDVKL